MENQRNPMGTLPEFENGRACYIVGVAGGTGSGKTTVANSIIKRMGNQSALLLQHDSYYRDFSNLTFEERCEINFDHPDALESELLTKHLQQLVLGEAIDVPIYNFSTHSREKTVEHVEARPIIVVEGILVLSDPALRDMFDLKIFVDTDADIRFIRRLTRDINERKRELDSVIRQYLDTTRSMHEKFVEPTRRHADIIVPEGGHNKIGINLLVAKLRTILAEGGVY